MNEILEIRAKQVKEFAIREIHNLMKLHDISIDEIKKTKKATYLAKLEGIRKERRQKFESQALMAKAREARAEKVAARKKAKLEREKGGTKNANVEVREESKTPA